MLMVRTKLELALIRPGFVTENGYDATIKIDEGRLNMLEVIAAQKAKGTQHIAF